MRQSLLPEGKLRDNQFLWPDISNPPTLTPKDLSWKWFFSRFFKFFSRFFQGEAAEAVQASPKGGAQSGTSGDLDVVLTMIETMQRTFLVFSANFELDG